MIIKISYRIIIGMIIGGVIGVLLNQVTGNDSILIKLVLIFCFGIFYGIIGSLREMQEHKAVEKE